MGASSNPCSENYKGVSAGTQPEVIAASQVVLRHADHIRTALSLHSYGKPALNHNILKIHRRLHLGYILFLCPLRALALVASKWL